MVNEQNLKFLKDLGVAAGIVAAQIIVIIILWHIFKRLQKKIESNAQNRIKPFVIKKLRVLSVSQITKTFVALLHIAKYLITLFQLFITVPIVFSIFPQTEQLASTIFGYILAPLKNIGLGMIGYIPNLFTIVIFLLVTKYSLRALKFFSEQIAKERLKIPGFYADWAYPTFNILRFLIYAFTVAVVFPYLPGSHSRIVQGVSVFVGVIFSLGSSTAIGNLVAGLVLTYMRPFKTGDRIQIQGNTGFVVKKDLMVVRIKTHKNEYITIPNMQVLSGSVINYNTSSDEDEEGLILNAEITYNYAAPWRLIHEILIEAALKTPHIQKHPEPFVLQTALENNCASYQINCYTKRVEKTPALYAELFQNIQDGFASRNLDMTTPEFRIILPQESRDPGPAAKGFWVKGAEKG